ncbi:MAG: diguanylate cyclase, partial [Rhodocyclaceae bacterium]|nr:diguanylate cyclase [Rhodocyclaceae bacterium]
QPYAVADATVTSVSASMGVTFFPADAADADTLVRHADQAMYLAKQAGRNRYQVFDIAQPGGAPDSDKLAV